MAWLPRLGSVRRLDLSRDKARTILDDQTVRGRPLTDKQRRFFGAIASGSLLKRRPKRRF